MIYTVTFNPSLDYIVSVKDFEIGKTNRTSSENMLPGGKGINVSTVLKNLGIKNSALGFTAGFTGEEIEKRVRKLGVDSDFISVKHGFSRINVKLKDFDGTEINGKGPEISREEIKQLLQKLEELKENDVLVLAGSIPEGMPDSMYQEIMKRLSGKGICFAVDATKDLLLNVLSYHPFLIKPNNHELGELFQTELNEKKDVIPYAEKLQELGAGNVLVSMAGQGAVLLTEEKEVYFLDAPKGKLVNAVGAGDSMVAGFLAGWEEKKDYVHAFKMGVAAGSASAFSELLAKKSEVQKIYETLQVSTWK
ncbi:Tagatose-6-phosphate kinase [uncultured Roseburia sp.]|uniref:Tagatose-6-phosphate kinase n=1 Tax=Brotonthovivens ammoniilytica TaxID=2981725 RepID=A0ABT2TLE1_9FIRM|nr:1-phosphofructokinase [Brotonthovivens ammoniilytica]MCU6763020.1 1-phosphofructokinase [Brotonthovivens ammoniilytica]SCJ00683.1 Tagatose-6-phosphate kinase [uncultured Roseburia sp.]